MGVGFSFILDAYPHLNPYLPSFGVSTIDCCSGLSAINQQIKISIDNFLPVSTKSFLKQPYLLNLFKVMVDDFCVSFF